MKIINFDEKMAEQATKDWPEDERKDWEETRKAIDQIMAILSKLPIPKQMSIIWSLDRCMKEMLADRIHFVEFPGGGGKH